MISSPPRRRIRVVGAAIFERGLLLIVRRPAHETGAGMWEFPGGKIELGESPAQAIKREIEEELGIQIQIEKDLGWKHHAYETVDIELNVTVCRRTMGDIVLHEHDGMEWVDPATLDPKRLLEADRPFVQDIIDWAAAQKR